MSKPDVPPPDPLDAASAAEAATARDAAPAEALPTPEQVAAWKARAEQAAQLEDRLKRAQADFVNESRRIQRQADQDRRYALEGLVRDLSQIVASLDTALRAANVEGDATALRVGLALVVQETEEVLKRHGAEVLRPVGRPFDPTQHEALAMVERADLPSGHVADVVSPGMILNGRVVKPARVTVARAPAAPAAPAEPASS